MEKLRDIKGLMIIDDYSLYVFIALVFTLLLLLAYLIKKILDKKRKPNIEKIARQKLKNLDFDDSKKCAYTISKYALHVSSKEELEKIEKLLEKYKYKKESIDFLDDDKSKIKEFLKSCDV